MNWLQRLLYRWRVQSIVSRLKAQEMCYCEMCLGSVMRWGVGRCRSCRVKQIGPCTHPEKATR